MSETAIHIENLSKLYRLGLVGTGSMAQDLNRWWARVRGREDPYARIGQLNDRSRQAAGDYVWALTDIDLSVRQGEVLGIIGTNGAGKSTLLKLLSRITSPTTGILKARGRIASLLEVGTGMHPELTARENIYLNGAIMGMNTPETGRKFDEIIEFAGCEMYVDTPVKRYSSGMRVRLGFAVAAFLEPDILVVDEVLAVGDAEFQRRAIGKMREVSSSTGRTVLFVSHNMTAVQNLCSRAILLEHGSLVADGDTETIVARYLQGCAGADESTGDLTSSEIARGGTGDARFASIEICNLDGQSVSYLPMGEGLLIRLRLDARDAIKGAAIALGLSTEQGSRLCGLDMKDTADWNLDLQAGQQLTVECRVASLNLGPGRYYLGIKLRDHSARQTFDHVERAVSFEVVPADVFQTGRTPVGNCPIFLTSKWNYSGSTESSPV